MGKHKIGVVGHGYWGKNQARVFDELGVLEGVFDSKLKRENLIIMFRTLILCKHKYR